MRKLTKEQKEDAARELRRILANLDPQIAARELGRVVSVKIASRIMGVSVRRIVDYIRQKRLPANRFGKDYVVRPADLARLERRPPGRPRTRSR